MGGSRDPRGDQTLAKKVRRPRTCYPDRKSYFKSGTPYVHPIRAKERAATTKRRRIFAKFQKLFFKKAVW